MSKLLKGAAIFWSAKKTWSFPARARVLVYDRSGEEFLRPYLASWRTETLAVRGEVVCLPCLLLSIFTRSFWMLKFADAYEDVFIQRVSPVLILTFVDNKKRFYRISGRHPGCLSLFIQNGMRGELTDIFPLEKDPAFQVDHMLVMGDIIGRHYGNSVSGRTTTIGSLKNNHIPINKVNSPAGVLFISEFKKDEGQFGFKNRRGELISYNRFYQAENQVLPVLWAWCQKSGRRLRIAGATRTYPEIENEYFSKILGSEDWEHVVNLDSFDSYRAVDSSEFVVSIDSTLGYESLARMKKTVLLPMRGNFVGEKFYEFGWPGEFPDDGPFWTNRCDPARFEELFDEIAGMDQARWERLAGRFMPDLIDFDAANSRLQLLLREILDKHESDKSN